MDNCVDEVIQLLKENEAKGIEYGKPLEYLCFRNRASKEDFEEDLLKQINLKLAIKQSINNEHRYALYFVYSHSKGRVYVLKFTNKIRVVTIFPLGRKTLIKYKKKGLKTSEDYN